jgi:hypothetical protein
VTSAVPPRGGRNDEDVPREAGSKGVPQYDADTSWEVPPGEVLEEVPAEVREELKKQVTRGREEITRIILTEARKIIPQDGIELVDVRIKRLDYVAAVVKSTWAPPRTAAWAMFCAIIVLPRPWGATRTMLRASPRESSVRAASMVARSMRLGQAQSKAVIGSVRAGGS